MQANLGYTPFSTVYNIYEKIQVTGFCIQEFIISGIYIFETRRLIKNDQILNSRAANRFLHHLIWVNIFIMAMDVAILGTEYANLYYMEAAFKPAIYAYKLRLEFSILNRLKSMLTSNRTTMSYEQSEGDRYYNRVYPDSRSSRFHFRRGRYSASAEKSTIRDGRGTSQSHGTIMATTEIEVCSVDNRAGKEGEPHTVELSPVSTAREDQIYAGPGTAVVQRPVECCCGKHKNYDFDDI